MSSDSKLPKALSRQHSREHSVPSVSPRFNVGLAPSSIRPLQRQIAVRDSVSFNGPNDPVSVYQLPRRIIMPPLPPLPPQSITQRLIPPPNLVALNDRLKFQQRNQQTQQQFQQQTELPPRVSPSRRGAVSIFEPFRNHVHTTESGNTHNLIWTMELL